MEERGTPVPADKQSERKELQTLNKRNYQKELDKLIENIQKEGKTPRLFLHACCAPCSSYVMEYLSQYFEITIFFYNPNIAPEEEYAHRVAEIRRLIGEMEFLWWRDGMIRRNFMRWQKVWRMFRKEESGAFGVTACGWKRQRNWRRRADMIISLQP